MAVADLRRRFAVDGALPRVDRRTLAGVGLAALAAVLVLLLTAPAPTVPVLVAGSDLPVGTALDGLDVTVRQVADATGLVAGDGVDDLAGWTLAVPIAAGEPLLPSALRPPTMTERPDLMAMTLDADHAVLGRLAAGDLVDVYVTWAPEEFGATSTTELLAESVAVVETVVDDAGFGTPQVGLLVAVDDQLAASLTAALRNGEIDLVRTGP